jgi:hypothetical protein
LSFSKACFNIWANLRASSGVPLAIDKLMLTLLVTDLVSLPFLPLEETGDADVSGDKYPGWSEVFSPPSGAAAVFAPPPDDQILPADQDCTPSAAEEPCPPGAVGMFSAVPSDLLVPAVGLAGLLSSPPGLVAAEVVPAEAGDEEEGDCSASCGGLER